MPDPQEWLKKGASKTVHFLGAKEESPFFSYFNIFLKKNTKLHCFFIVYL